MHGDGLAAYHRVELAPVDLGLSTRQSGLRDPNTFAGVPTSRWRSPRGSCPPRPSWDSEINTPFSSARRLSRIRFAVWRCLGGRMRRGSTTNTSRIQACHAPVNGAERTGTLQGCGLRRRQRRTDISPVHSKAGRQTPGSTARHVAPSETNLLVQLPPSTTAFPSPRTPEAAATTTGPGGANSNRRDTPKVGPNQTVVLTQVDFIRQSARTPDVAPAHPGRGPPTPAHHRLIPRSELSSCQRTPGASRA